MVSLVAQIRGYLKGNMQAKMEVTKAPLFDLIGKSIRKGLIENGMDLPLKESLDDLKLKFRSLVNDGLGTNVKTSTLGSPQEQEITVPKTTEEIVKAMTGADISQYNRSKTHTDLMQSKLTIMNNYENLKAENSYLSTRFRMQIDQNETFESQHEAARTHFNGCVYVFKNSDGTLKVLINPGVDLTPYLKLVCTTDTGDTTKARNKFEHYKKNKRETGQHYAEWALTDAGAKYVQRNFIDVSTLVNAVRDNDTIAVDNLLNNIKSKAIRTDLKDKIQGIQSGEATTPGIRHINNINKLIANLEIKKVIEPTKVTYTLVTSIESDLETSDGNTKQDFLDKIKAEIKLWQVGHEKVWFEKFVKVAVEILTKITNRYTL
jgi:hypothetical protein